MSSRYYYKKKNRKSKYQSIQDVFNPTLQNAPFPNYYQQKGRTIQTSPLRLWEQDGRVITRQDLDRMYRKLVEYKYPIVYQLASIPTTFLVTPVFVFGDLFSSQDDYILTTPKFNTLMNEYMFTYYPKIQGKYTFQFCLMTIQFNVETGISYAQDWRFEIGWQTNLLNDIRILIQKNVDHFIPASSNPGPIDARPMGLQNEYFRITTPFIRYNENGGLSYTYITTPSNDPTIADNGSYPFIDTSATPTDLYRGQIVYHHLQGDIRLTEPKFRFFVLCKAHN